MVGFSVSSEMAGNTCPLAKSLPKLGSMPATGSRSHTHSYCARIRGEENIIVWRGTCKKLIFIPTLSETQNDWSPKGTIPCCATVCFASVSLKIVMQSWSNSLPVSVKEMKGLNRSFIYAFSSSSKYGWCCATIGEPWTGPTPMGFLFQLGDQVHDNRHTYDQNVKSGRILMIMFQFCWKLLSLRVTQRSLHLNTPQCVMASTFWNLSISCIKFLQPFFKKKHFLEQELQICLHIFGIFFCMHQALIHKHA